VSETAPPAPRLPLLLVEEVAQLRAFLDLLGEEEKALVAGDVDRLLPLAGEKSALFTRLADLGTARGRLLQAAALTADRSGMEAWLGRQAEAGAARRSWAELLDLAAQARSRNDSNGKLIATRLANNQQALASLLAAANQAALYGPDGQASPLGGGRSLGSV